MYVKYYFEYANQDANTWLGGYSARREPRDSDHSIEALAMSPKHLVT